MCSGDSDNIRMDHVNKLQFTEGQQRQQYFEVTKTLSRNTLNFFFRENWFYWTSMPVYELLK